MGKIDFKKYFNYTKWIAKDARPHLSAIIRILLIEVILALVNVANAIASKNLVDNAVNKDMKTAAVVAIIFGGLIIVNLGLRAASSLISTRTLELYSNNLRQRLFDRIAGTEWWDISKYHSGDLLTRLTSDIGNVVNGVVYTLPTIISLGVQLIAAFATLLFYEPTLAILAFILGPVTVIFSRLWGQRLKFLQVKIQESESMYRSFIQESLQNLMIVKAFRLENQTRATIGSLHSERLKWVLERNKTSVIASTMLGSGYWVGYFLAFGWGVFRLSQGTTTFGTMTAFLQLVGQVQGPFIGLSRTLPQVISALASTGRLIEIEELQMEDKACKISLDFDSLGIGFRGVDFSYNKGEMILEKAIAFIKNGEITALIGSSGEGKTTMIRLILSLLKPASGMVYFKTGTGEEITASSSTREWIAYVPQGNTLFSGTIASNLSCGLSGTSEEDLIAAIKASCAWEFIMKLPYGINTVIGEHGLGLSEGQAQRIAIARALIRKSPILILDEATSSLDMDLEMRVLENIRNIKPAPTCLVITHRPSAINICSNILKLNNGNLIEVFTEDNIADDMTTASSEVHIC